MWASRSVSWCLVSLVSTHLACAHDAAAQVRTVSGTTPCAEARPKTARPGALADGDELFAIAPETMTELSISGPAWRVSTHRWTAGDAPFFITSSQRGEADTLCSSGPAFVSLASAFSHLRVRRVLTFGEADSLFEASRAPSIKLTIANDAVERGEWQLVQSSNAGALVAYTADLPPVELDLDPQLLLALARGCAQLGVGSTATATGDATP